MRAPLAVVTGRLGPVVAGPVIVYLALFHGVLTVAAAVAVCFTVTVWPRPDLALLMLLGLVPAAALADPHGMALSALGLGAVFLLLLRMVCHGLRPRPDLTLILLLTVTVSVSYLLPQSDPGPVPSWTGWALLLVGLGILAASMAYPPDPRRVAQLTAVAGAFTAGSLLLRGEYATDRLTGLGLNPNYVGAALALPLVAAIGLARLDRSALWLPPALLCGAAIVQTRSRGAFLMVAAGLACALLAGRPRRHKVFISLLLLVPTLALPGTLDSMGDGLTGNRSSTELTANTEVRKEAAWLAVRVAADHPFRGIGYAMFPEYARSSSLGIYINTHNDFLRLAAESGLVSLALFTALLWRGLARRHTGHHAVLQSLGVAYAVGMLFANTLTDLIVSVPFWVALGCVLAQRSPGKQAASPTPLHVRTSL